ncbi:MAG TPA: lytic murein transglycosylase B [Steroidobacteraceae bacterium]|nr:lytic murein transglycosylase B [Steroidobacteraceae bacterium]
MQLRHRVGLSLLAAGSCLSPAHQAAAIDTRRADVAGFIEHMVAREAYDPHTLRRILRAARTQPAIVAAMEKPAEKRLAWYRYRPIFVNEQRIQEGVDFWLAHRRDLERSSARTGVAPQYLVAIVGVETYYGRLTGNYRVLDALSTLAFDYPPRARFFRGELAQFLLLARDQRIDPLTAMGSYAGAMGAPQFMPSSYRRFGLDATADGHVDLWSNWPDVFDSVGYFLEEHGWSAGQAVLRDATVAPGSVPKPAGPDLGAATTVAALRAEGVHIDDAPGADRRAWLIAAKQANGVAWRVGFGNFYAITRYNHSPLYAMAVHDLAVAVQRRVDASLEPLAEMAHHPPIASQRGTPRPTPRT